jgi:hypothetical protein
MTDENVIKWLGDMSPMPGRSNVSDGSSLSLRGGKQMLQADSASAMSTESTRQPFGEMQVLKLRLQQHCSPLRYTPYNLTNVALAWASIAR